MLGCRPSLRDGCVDTMRPKPLHKIKRCLAKGNRVAEPGSAERMGARQLQFAGASVMHVPDIYACKRKISNSARRAEWKLMRFKPIRSVSAVNS